MENKIFIRFLCPQNRTFLRRTTLDGENASKNWDTERVVIPKQLQTELRQMKLHDYPLDYYLIGLDGHPTKDRVSVNVWSNRHRKVLKINGFEYGGMKYSLYSWKHTGVVLLAKNKAPMIMIQRQLRHKSIETTQEYLKSLGISDMGELEDLFPNI